MRMNRKSVNIGVCLSVLAYACCCVGEAVEMEKGEAIVCKLSLFANESKLAAEAVGAELRVLPRQPLSKGAMEFSIALSNYSNKKMVFRADALLDAMRISLKNKSDSSIALPENVRFRINAPVLPPRPYAISGWRTVTGLPDGAVTTNELSSAILESNDPKELRKAKVEIPAASTLVLDFKIVALAKTTKMQQRPEIAEVRIAKGEYTLGLSMLLFFHKNDSNKSYMRFGVESPVVITVYQDAEPKHE